MQTPVDFAICDTDFEESDLPELPAFKTPSPPTMPEWVASFCQWYVVVRNGRIAYDRARPGTKDPAKKAHALRQGKNVRTYIAALQRELATGETGGPATRAQVVARYKAIMDARPSDYAVVADDAHVRWKRPDELTPAQLAAVREMKVERIKPVYDKQGNELVPGKSVIVGYELLDPERALGALRALDAMDRSPKVKVDHRHMHAHEVADLFAFVARNERTSETCARLRAKHGRAGARIFEHQSLEAEAADPRALRKLKGV